MDSYVIVMNASLTLPHHIDPVCTDTNPTHERRTTTNQCLKIPYFPLQSLPK
jgi:hypothetical protein